jgi:hypothetical protein
VKRWLADARVHNATANAIQREPVLALDLNRNGFLAWVDYRAGLPFVTRKVTQTEIVVGTGCASKR